MPAEMMEDWVNSMWNKRPGLQSPQNMLIMDVFRGH